MEGHTLIIDRLILVVNPDELRTKEEDKLILTCEQRRWVRGRFTTVKGRKIGVALPTGTVLQPDSILWTGPDWYLKIEAAAESVLEINPSGYEQAVTIAFEVGNRHFQLAIREDKLFVPDNIAMTRLMDRLSVSWTRKEMVFDPIGNTQQHPHG